MSDAECLLRLLNRIYPAATPRTMEPGMATAMPTVTLVGRPVEMLLLFDVGTVTLVGKPLPVDDASAAVGTPTIWPLPG